MERQKPKMMRVLVQYADGTKEYKTVRFYTRPLNKNAAACWSGGIRGLRIGGVLSSSPAMENSQSSHHQQAH